MQPSTSGEPSDHEERTRQTALLVDRLHAIVEELELLHPGRKFPMDGHLVGSLAEAAAEAIFDITLKPPSNMGYDAISEPDHRAVEIKGTYGTGGVAIRPTSHAHASALIVLRLSRKSGEPHEIVYNGPFAVAAAAAGPVGSNGQARIGLNRLRVLNKSVDDVDRVRRRDLEASTALDVE
ncbi:MAG TPA: hypothetical protein VFC01_22705 [Mycobacterium sp.]|nr:hypothetical protein [Mycobacterium sp.]